VKVNVLSILPNGGPLPAVCLNAFDPTFSSLGDGVAIARRAMDTVANIDPDGCMIGVRIFFPLERLNMPGAVLIEVVDDPGLFGLALGRDPLALAYRRCTLPL
jgi:hypothetical protein